MCFVKAPRGSATIPTTQLTGEQQQPVCETPFFNNDATLWGDFSSIDSLGQSNSADLAIPLNLAVGPSMGFSNYHSADTQSSPLLGVDNTTASDSLATLDSLSSNNLDIWLDLLSSSDLGPVAKPLFPVEASTPLAASTGEPAQTSPVATTQQKYHYNKQLPTHPNTNMLGGALLPSPPESTCPLSPLLPIKVCSTTPTAYSRSAVSSMTPASSFLPMSAIQHPSIHQQYSQHSQLHQQRQSQADAHSTATTVSADAKISQTLPVSSTPPLTKRKTDEDLAAHDDAYNGSNPLAVKRARNNEAARRSRERKMKKLVELEVQVTHLDTEKTDLLVRLAVLESERTTWMHRERELAHRVLALETQLSESHRALMHVGLNRNSHESTHFSATDS
ncbi:hypothetical protein BATDEDRAFT_36745 [Batrachochytrium dendrobatidis JAM81]|uniref:BZIP domain-containing protein n=2 Tax=Batrachochytrium dendrobatidis TaxID=109871 RepID=F4NXT1_BATDJ|nr:uncharacterized protein BATDEDRAFT_36745 [Batrachochytrium dendrobatidis JAM81]EGF82194.1 hypothetical protein BATDEDRAFT_36745 [Batrachochytrium dendrobatidis JAM81]KAK5670760.1 hypothetical protein QVD99_002531 [Batrachochytrium dendrobatidis]OAJ40567.1 hypothetical protein BDEG_24285 [Batrachochytrium dendrobatidis JEL423]|eukprot:XP_006677485.1 hypothetical protein BATDEDRAFT_36745 [Batrachochytrium dendrobatidis JAM81]